MAIGIHTEALSRRERERLMRRQEILHAARTVFAEKGYTHATIDEIAQRAEFGKGTIYNYFEGGKEDILFAILDDVYDDMCRIAEEKFAPHHLQEQRFRDVFYGFVKAHMDYFLECHDLFMIIVKEAYRMIFSDDPGKARYFQHQRSRLVAGMAPTLAAAMERGEMRPLDPMAVAHMILGNINGLQMHCSLEEQHPAKHDSVLRSSDAAADFLTRMLFDGLSTTRDS